MIALLIHTCALGGSRIFAHADGSSGPELFRTIFSRTVTESPFVTRVTISLLSFAWPRTLTMLATTVAGPGTSGTVFSSGAGAFFLAMPFFGGVFWPFFLPAFFLPACAAGALVVVVAGASVAAGAAAGVSIGAGGVGLVACCANK